jgi:hypothetical protein
MESSLSLTGRRASALSDRTRALKFLLTRRGPEFQSRSQAGYAEGERVVKALIAPREHGNRN